MSRKAIPHIFKDNEEYKWCSKCKQYHKLNIFFKNKITIDKLSKWCKVCQKIQKEEYYLKNKQIVKKRSHDTYLKNKDNIKKRHEQWRKNNPNYPTELRTKNIERYKKREL